MHGYPCTEAKTRSIVQNRRVIIRQSYKYWCNSTGNDKNPLKRTLIAEIGCFVNICFGVSQIAPGRDIDLKLYQICSAKSIEENPRIGIVFQSYTRSQFCGVNGDIPGQTRKGDLELIRLQTFSGKILSDHFWEASKNHSSASQTSEFKQNVTSNKKSAAHVLFQVWKQKGIFQGTVSEQENKRELTLQFCWWK